MSDALWQKARWLAGWVTRMSMNNQAVSVANEILEGPERLPESAQPAERAGEWVSVEERLPEDDRIVLVWNDAWGSDSFAATGRHVDDGTDLGSWCMEDDDDDPEPITHWMPLPPLPQPKGKP